MGLKIFTMILKPLETDNRFRFCNEVANFCKENVDTKVTWVQSQASVEQATLTATVQFRDVPTSSDRDDDSDNIGMRAHL